MMAGMEVRDFVGEYHIGEIIGVGTNSQVRLATHHKTLQQVAVKIVSITKPSIRPQAFREATILKEIGYHKNIVKFVAFYCDDTRLYLFMEYASGGDLYSYVQKTGPPEEAVARQFCKQLIESLWYCHSNSIAHHDVKLENVLVAADLTLRLSDFGYAHKIKPHEPINFFGGSPLYMSPEVFSLLPHNEKVDVWSLGVCFYYLVFGTYPFIADRYEDLQARVLFEEVPFPATLDPDLLDLLRGMLEKDPTKRLTLSDVRNHKWCMADSRPSTTNIISTITLHKGAGNSPYGAGNSYNGAGNSPNSRRK